MGFTYCLQEQKKTPESVSKHDATYKKTKVRIQILTYTKGGAIIIISTLGPRVNSHRCVNNDYDVL